MTHPTELSDLDRIVAHLMRELDDEINWYENDGTPPTAEQAKEWEDERFAAYQQQYDGKAKDKCGRDPANDQDNISVRKRMLGRQQESRRGKLFARFSDDVAGLVVKASMTLQNCVESLAELQSNLTDNLPLKASIIASEFTALNVRLEDSINASFPDGVAGLDNYDDELPEGIPSYENFKTSVMAAQEEVMNANVEAVDNAIIELKAGVAAAIEEDLSDDVVEFMEDDGEELKGTIVAAIKAALEVE